MTIDSSIERHCQALNSGAKVGFFINRLGQLNASNDNIRKKARVGQAASDLTALPSRISLQHSKWRTQSVYQYCFFLTCELKDLVDF